jgi:hypothetical protein
LKQFDRHYLCTIFDVLAAFFLPLPFYSLCEYFRIHRQTLKLWLMQSRAGKSDFPLPVSPFGKKLRWRREDIVSYQSGIGNVKALPKALSPAKRQQRQAAR